MLRTHLIASTRRLLRERSYALTNIMGLALGLASFLALVLYMEFELGYDRHHLGHEEIYRVATEVATGDDVELLAVTSRPLGPLLKESFPEVVDFARVERSSFKRQVLRNRETAMYWDNVLLADPNIFRVLSHRVIYGDAETALVDPLSIAISERVSRAYFGDRNPIGETLEAETAAYRISLVFEELPANSHMRYDVLLSYNRIAAFAAADPPPITEQLWQSPPNYTYLVMEPGYDPRQFAAVSSRFYEQYMAGTNEHGDRSMRFYLEPLADIHHYSETQYDWPSGNRYHVLAIATVAFFVLCVACINYVNLATARSTKLSREVGMRKLLGASRAHVRAQYLVESILLAVVSGIAALAFVWVFLASGQADAVLGLDVGAAALLRPPIVLFLVLVVGLAGLLSGLHPATVLSSMSPANAIRPITRTGVDKGGAFRKALVFGQMAISVAVITSAVMMVRQMQFIHGMPVGFEREGRLVVPLHGADTIEKVGRLKNELGSLPGVVGVATASSLPGESTASNPFEVETTSGVFESHLFNRIGVDADFFDVLGVRIVEGRNFGPATTTEETVLVNQATVDAMGWRNAIGKRINFYENRAVVVGVVENFNFQSAHRKVAPLLIHMIKSDYQGEPNLWRAIANQAMVVHVLSDGVSGLLRHLQENWHTVDPKHPLEYEFLDTKLRAVYGDESAQIRLVGTFAVSCVLLSCLGLLGLVAYTTERRAREISIRKVVGASTRRIVALLIADISWVVLAATLLGGIGAYWAVSWWLGPFEYRMPLHAYVFVPPALLPAALAYVMVSIQVHRAVTTKMASVMRPE